MTRTRNFMLLNIFCFVFVLSSIPTSSFASDHGPRLELEAEYYLFEVGENAVSIVTGDWNEDGRPDVATTTNTYIANSGNTYGLSVLLGAGRFRLRSATRIALDSAPRCLRTVDVDRDGHADLIVTGDFGTTILRGDGAGGFARVAYLAIQGRRLEVGDLDRDGNADLCVVRPDNGITVALLRGATLVEARDLAVQAQDLKLGDFDKDGDLDLATGDFQGVVVRFNDGTGRFGSSAVYPEPYDGHEAAHALAIGDLDGDHCLDLVGVLGKWPGWVVPLLGRCDGTFVPRYPPPEPHWRYAHHAIALADLSGDGRDEVVTLNAERGHEVMRMRSAAGPNDVAFADMDGDGKRDVLVASSGAVVIHPGNGSGSIRHNTYARASGGWPSKMADIDRDGYQDVAVRSDGGFAIIYGAPSGFGPREELSGSYDNVYDFADIDGDGWVDILTGQGVVYRGLGGRRFDDSGVRFSSYGTDALATGDLDGDGDTDLVLAKWQGEKSIPGIVSIAMGDGHGAFGPPRDLDVRARHLLLDDLDRDGHLDVIASDENGASIVYGDGDGMFSPPLALDRPGRFASLFRADIDGNGALDILGARAVFLGAGRSYRRVELNVWVEAAADLDRDGHVDLIGAHAVYRGDGRGGFHPAVAFGPGGTIYLDDRDQDGWLDLLVLRQDGEDEYESTITWIPNRSTVNQAPMTDAAVATLARAWPPNHEWTDVAVDGVRDPDDDPVTIEVMRVTQDEPAGTESGRPEPSATESAGAQGHRPASVHCPDASISNGRARVRVERDGNGNGRVYTLWFVARDPSGAATEGRATVCVPLRPGSECIDDGQRFNAIQCRSRTLATESLPDMGEALEVAQFVPGSVSLRYTVASAGPVSLEIFDLVGRRIEVLDSMSRTPGEYERVWSGPQGVYYAKLVTGGRPVVKPIVLVR